jgi:hypothetical protein
MLFTRFIGYKKRLHIFRNIPDKTYNLTLIFMFNIIVSKNFFNNFINRGFLATWNYLSSQNALVAITS